MGFVTGGSCFLHSPLYKFPLPSSSQSNSWTRNAQIKRKLRAPMAFLRQEKPNEGPFYNKRTFLFMGIAVLPLIGLRAGAIEGLTTQESEVKTPEGNQKTEAVPQTERPTNPFLSGIVIFSSGVLGALYALAQKENTAADATIETMNSKLKEKEDLIVSLSRNYESKIFNEKEERTKQLDKAKEEQKALINQLKSANSTITHLGQQLKSEKIFIEKLELQIVSLENKLSKTDSDKRDLENSLKEKTDSVEMLQDRINLLTLDLKDKEDTVQDLSSFLAEKELELRNLNSAYKQIKDDLYSHHLQIQGVKDELLKSQEEVEAKDSLVNELNARVSSLILENTDYTSKYDVMQKEYNKLKLTAEKKTALDAELLREKEEKIHQLKEKLELVLNETSINKAIIADLNQEKEKLKESLENESKKVNSLNFELQITQENVGNSRNEAAELEKRLNESNKLCTQLEIEISKLSAELSEVRGSLQGSLDDAKLGAEKLANELRTAKEHLKKTQQELQTMSRELTVAHENRDNLQRELVDVCRRAETAAEDLKEEKKFVASLSKDLEDLEKQVSKDKKAQRSLEIDLEEATKALDEMNRNALILSNEMERVNSLVSSLENDKEVLYRSLTEQKNASKEAQENIDDAHNLIMRLGKEREILENRGTKLEEELASAKGEILRLRSRINSLKVHVNDEQLRKDEGESKITTNARKNVRRRKASPNDK